MQALNPVQIMVVGIGGAGCNAVDRMISVEIPEVDFVVMNTDAQALGRSEAGTKLYLGGPRARGLGAGGNPELGADAARQSADEIAATLDGADMVFITAGMGGGTGSGAAPIVAEIARSQGALTVAVVTRPFSFEGYKRQQVAQAALAALQASVDALIVVPNDRLLSFISDKVTLDVAFRIADDVLRQGVQGITEVVTKPGLINVDFADVRKIMASSGICLMSIGQAKGPERALEAAQSAVANPLIDNDSIAGATGILVNVVGGPDMSLYEASQAVQYITEQASPDAEVIFGAVVDNSMGDKIQITLVATGIDGAQQVKAKPNVTLVGATSRDNAKDQAGTHVRLPREFEEQLAMVRSTSLTPQVHELATAAPAMAQVPTPSPVSNLDVPAFLRRVRNVF